MEKTEDEKCSLPKSQRYKYSYDRKKVVRLGKAFNYNQILGYVE